MAFLEPLELKLNEVLVTKAPFTLPKKWREWLATYAWIFSLVGFVIGLFSILILLPALGIATGVSAVVGLGSLWVLAWIALIVLVGYVVLLGLATPKLKRMQKSGWNLIFYSNIFFAVYDVFNALYRLNIGSIFGLIWNLAGTVVALYFIFQIRSYFLKRP